MFKYTVLLLYPDYLAEQYGEETYLAHVTGGDPVYALRAAREQAAAGAEVCIDPNDFFCLLIIHGHHDDLHNPRDKGTHDADSIAHAEDKASMRQVH